ncbi:MAG: response regulator transcription factor [Anaerolineae bacterium]|nr:response regulator transcription factor [Anaerolineae bacterium]MDW8102747.1 response regulator transcription factor [Anaerolineae bacterium]
MKPKILLIDDDPKEVEHLSEILKLNNYEVAGVTNPEEALTAVFLENPDLIVLDIMMPGISGWDICSRIREFSSVPILVLTCLSRDEDKIRGLELGADDYLTKPFNPREFILRIGKLLERTTPSLQETTVEVGDLKIDLVGGKAYKGGEEIHLTKQEKRLLFYLVRHRGRTVPHDELLRGVWGAGSEGDLNLLKTYIHRVRVKVEDDPQKPRYILTDRGVGYRFATVSM